MMARITAKATRIIIAVLEVAKKQRHTQTTNENLEDEKQKNFEAAPIFKVSNLVNQGHDKGGDNHRTGRSRDEFHHQP